MCDKRTRFVWWLLAFWVISVSSTAKTEYVYRVYLTDKSHSTYTLECPTDYLSKAAMERRIKYGIPIDSTDLPVSAYYLDSIKNAFPDATISYTSKWMNTVLVRTNKPSHDLFTSLPFVKAQKLVYKSESMLPESTPDELSTTVTQNLSEESANEYGEALAQIEMLNGLPLHEAGYRGEGVKIALLDAGFMNVDKMEAFAHMTIADTYNYYFPVRGVFGTHSHGTSCLSAIAAWLPGTIIGTAPEAEYHLYITEDADKESPIEEDYWICAAERADSIGVDMLCASLGYTGFDDYMLYDRLDSTMLDGKTAYISKGMGMAADKGILVIVSAGNEGESNWKHITFPSDVENVVTVGAVDENGLPTSFSGRGSEANASIKPDFVALGHNAAVLDDGGKPVRLNGTSFSTPIVAGLFACMKQAFPLLSNNDLCSLLRRNASMSASPDREMGYGLPDFGAAFRNTTYRVEEQSLPMWKIICADEAIYLSHFLKPCEVALYSMDGKILYKADSVSDTLTISLKNYQKGLYLLVINDGTDNFRYKLIL